MEDDRSPREGAIEESSVRMASCELDARLKRAADTAAIALPQHLAEPRPVPASLDFLRPDPSYRPMVPLEDIVETSPVRYFVVPTHDSVTEVLTCTVSNRSIACKQLWLSPSHYSHGLACHHRHPRQRVVTLRTRMRVLRRHQSRLVTSTGWW